MRWSQGKIKHVNMDDFHDQSSHRGHTIKRKKAENMGRTSPFRGLVFIFSGLLKIWVALKFLLFRFNTAWLTKSNILWLKIGLAGFAIITVMRNDFQFSINFSGDQVKQTSMSNEPIDQMGIAQSMVLKAPSIAKVNTMGVRGKRKAKEESVSLINVEDYITNYEELAKKEMQRFGIPASFKMAQAILASNSGNNQQTRQFNNHFGKHLKGINFDSDWSNWRAHSMYLIENYPELLQVGSDYMAWVKTLSQTTYSRDQEYAQQLLQIIKDHKLYELDH